MKKLLLCTLVYASGIVAGEFSQEYPELPPTLKQDVEAIQRNNNLRIKVLRPMYKNFLAKGSPTAYHPFFAYNDNNVFSAEQLVIGGISDDVATALYVTDGTYETMSSKGIWRKIEKGNVVDEQDKFDVKESDQARCLLRRSLRMTGMFLSVNGKTEYMLNYGNGLVSAHGFNAPLVTADIGVYRMNPVMLMVNEHSADIYAIRNGENVLTAYYLNVKEDTLTAGILSGGQDVVLGFKNGVVKVWNPEETDCFDDGEPVVFEDQEIVDLVFVGKDKLMALTCNKNAPEGDQLRLHAVDYNDAFFTDSESSDEHKADDTQTN